MWNLLYGLYEDRIQGKRIIGRLVYPVIFGNAVLGKDSKWQQDMDRDRRGQFEYTDAGTSGGPSLCGGSVSLSGRRVSCVGERSLVDAPVPFYCVVLPEYSYRDYLIPDFFCDIDDCSIQKMVSGF